VEPTQEQAYQRRIAELEAENADLKAMVAELRAENADLKALVAKLRAENADLKALVAELRAENADLKALVAELRAQVARLSEQIAKLSKNSSNSSKPPSSDIVKPPKPTSSKKANSRKKKRKIRGQPGHAKHERPPFSPEEIDDVREYRLNCCPDCGGAVSARPKEVRVVQQVELVEKPVEMVEHRAEGCWCRRCKKMVYAPLPATVQKGGLVGPELTALGVCPTNETRVHERLLSCSKTRYLMPKVPSESRPSNENRITRTGSWWVTSRASATPHSPRFANTFATCSRFPFPAGSWPR